MLGKRRILLITKSADLAKLIQEALNYFYCEQFLVDGEHTLVDALNRFDELHQYSALVTGLYVPRGEITADHVNYLLGLGIPLIPESKEVRYLNEANIPWGELIINQQKNNGAVMIAAAVCNHYNGGLMFYTSRPIQEAFEILGGAISLRHPLEVTKEDPLKPAELFFLPHQEENIEDVAHAFVRAASPVYRDPRFPEFSSYRRN